MHYFFRFFNFWKYRLCMKCKMHRHLKILPCKCYSTALLLKKQQKKQQLYIIIYAPLVIFVWEFPFSHPTLVGWTIIKTHANFSYIRIRVKVSSLFLSLRMVSTQTWPQQKWTLFYWLIVACCSYAEEPACTQIGDLDDAQLIQSGDIMLGGIFSFHSSWKNIQDNYEKKPCGLQCTRWKLLW